MFPFATAGTKNWVIGFLQKKPKICVGRWCPPHYHRTALNIHHSMYVEYTWVQFFARTEFLAVHQIILFSQMKTEKNSKMEYLEIFLQAVHQIILFSQMKTDKIFQNGISWNISSTEAHIKSYSSHKWKWTNFSKTKIKNIALLPPHYHRTALNIHHSMYVEYTDS